jgi:hypothetical protein
MPLKIPDGTPCEMKRVLLSIWSLPSHQRAEALAIYESMIRAQTEAAFADAISVFEAEGHPELVTATRHLYSIMTAALIESDRRDDC